MSQIKRQKRVAERIQQELSDAVLRLADPRLHSVTITDAEVSPDLRVAKIWYSVLGDDEELKTATAALNKAAGALRHELAVRINMRYTPELIFRLDASWKRGARVDQLLEQIAVESPQMTLPAEAKRLIQSASRILVICHIMPDGDAVGSLLGMGWALRKLGKSCTLACADPFPEKYKFLPGHEDVHNQRAGDEDLIITLDSSDTERLGALYDATVFGHTPVINIDHHITNIKFGRVNWVEQVAATAELALALIEALDIPLDANIAACLLTGLVTDTRCFRTPNTTQTVLGHAITLMDAGASLAEITEKAFGQNSLSRLCIWGKALASATVRDGLIWARLSLEDFKSCGASWQDTEDLVSFLLSTRDMNASLLLQEREPGKVEASLRAVRGVNVAGVAFSLGGGGHPQASGCTVAGTMEQVEAKVLAALFQTLREQGRL